jgi:hypothetical protein
MARAYLGDDADALDGFEFLTMAEAGEVGHREIADVLAQKAGNKQVRSSRPGRFRSSSATSRTLVKAR